MTAKQLMPFPSYFSSSEIAAIHHRLDILRDRGSRDLWGTPDSGVDGGSLIGRSTASKESFCSVGG